MASIPPVPEDPSDSVLLCQSSVGSGTVCACCTHFPSLLRTVSLERQRVPQWGQTAWVCTLPLSLPSKGLNLMRLGVPSVKW